MLKTILVITLRVGLTIGIGFALILFLMQDSMIYMPTSYRDEELAVFKQEGGERMSFETGEGKQTAFYLPPAVGDIEPEKIWIVSGGNGARALDYMDTLQGWHAKWAFLFIDFPGYGLCEGDPSPKTIRENTTQAIEDVAKKWGWDDMMISERFCAFGHSIGSAAVLRAAADFGMRRAIVVAPFTTMMEMAKASIGSPFCYCLRHRFDNEESLEALQKIGAEVTIFHGENDRIIPVGMSRRLARDFAEIVTYEEVKGGDHNRIVGMLKSRLKEEATGAGKP